LTDQPIGFTLTYRGRSPEGLSSLNCVNSTKPGHSRQAAQAFSITGRKEVLWRKLDFVLTRLV